MIRRVDDFCISSRRRLQDSIFIDNSYITIDKLIETNPVQLWNLIHSKGSKIQLVSNVYFKLKQVISKVAPELIAINDTKRTLFKRQRKLSKAISTGAIGTDKSSYKRLI
jgi:hypothetical protein